MDLNFGCGDLSTMLLKTNSNRKQYVRNHVTYLNRLEAMASNCDPKQFYLWPRTPIKDHMQEEIIQRTGVSDFDLSQGHSRPRQIISLIKTLLNDGSICREFSILDFPCGDAIVLWQIKKSFPQANCYGLDCNKGVYTTHEMVQRDGVLLYRAFLQDLFINDPVEPFDLALMLNTYRGWRSAGLRASEENLPKLADSWFARNTRFAVITATDIQVSCLIDLGFSAIEIGKGEDNSKMICISRSPLRKA